MDVGQPSMKTVITIVLLLISGSSCADTNDFSSLHNAWGHIRSVYRQTDHLRNWEPTPFDKMPALSTEIGGHTFAVMHFSMAQNGSLYIAEQLKGDRYRIVGQCHGARIAFREELGSIVARVHYHVSASEGSDTDLVYSNGVFGAFEMKDIRPEFYK
jgi:hypothetical protein